MKYLIYKFPLFAIAVLAIFMVTGFAGCENSTSSEAIEHYNKGVDLSDEGKYDEAMVEYNRALAIDQNYAYAYVNRGYCYLMKKQYPMAIADYSVAIDLDSGNPRAYNGRGAAYLYIKQYELALADFNQAIKIDPNFTKAYENRDYAIKMSGETDTTTSDISGWPMLSDENKIFIFEQTINGYINDDNGNCTYSVVITVLRACGGKPTGGDDYPYRWDSPDNLAALGICLDTDGLVYTYGDYPLKEGTSTFNVEVTDGKITARGKMTLVVTRIDVSAKDGIPGVPGPSASLQQWPQEVVDKYPLPCAQAGHYYGVTLPILGGNGDYYYHSNKAYIEEDASATELFGTLQDCVFYGMVPSSLAGKTMRFDVILTDGNGDTDPYQPLYAIKVLP